MKPLTVKEIDTMLARLEESKPTYDRNPWLHTPMWTAIRALRHVRNIVETQATPASKIQYRGEKKPPKPRHPKRS